MKFPKNFELSMHRPAIRARGRCHMKTARFEKVGVCNPCGSTNDKPPAPHWGVGPQLQPSRRTALSFSVMLLYAQPARCNSTFGTVAWQLWTLPTRLIDRA